MSEAGTGRIAGAQDAAHVPPEHDRPPLLPHRHGELRKPILLLGTTIAITAVRLVLDQAKYYSSLGWDVHIACAPTQGIETLRQCDAITVHEIPMPREMSPLRDAMSLVQWIRVLRSIDPDIVMSGTPKAGFLSMVASWITRVPARIYLLRGLRAEGLTGRRRTVSLMTERVASLLSTEVVSVSPSLRDRYMALGLTSSRKIWVLGYGSSNGVDTNHFRPPTPQERMRARHRWGFTESDIVFGFVGRLTEDKGISDLLAAYGQLGKAGESKLLIVGPEDFGSSEGDSTPEQTNTPQDIVRAGTIADPRETYWAMDALVLPSFREGFPNVVLEASSSGLPVVTTTATGCIDSVLPGVTGFLYSAGDVIALAMALRSLMSDAVIRSQMGQSGRAHVDRNYSSMKVWNEYAEFLSRQVGRE